jgi:hypothetical protein
MRTLIASALVVVASAACGPNISQTTPDQGGGSSGPTPLPIADDPGPAPDAGAPDAAPTRTVVHLTQPVVTNGGGPVLSAPVFVPVTFDEDTDRAAIESFVSAIGATSYWKQATAEYGVGPAKSGTPVHLAAAAPTAITLAEIEAFIVQHAGVDWPAPTAQTLYVLFYPATTTITADTATACKDLGGWHAEIARSGQSALPYAVLPRCASFNGLSGMDSLTNALSHELAEAATDPFPKSQPAYRDVDDASAAWAVVLAGQTEVGDMCVNETQADAVVSGLGVVQRIWSNAAAKAGHDPCVPAPSAPYFNAEPDTAGTIVIIGDTGQRFSVPGVPVPLSSSRQTTVRVYSDAPTAALSIRAIDVSELLGGQPELQLSLDRTSGANGDTLKLTITRLRAPTHYGTSPFAIMTKLGGTTHYWFGLAG